MGQQTSTVTRASDFDPTQARLTGADGGTPITTEIIYGQDDHGTDFKVFGDTSGSYMLFDESADLLKLVNAGIQIGTLSSTAQNGYPLTSTNNNVIDSFADDNNTTLGNAVYSNIRARTMLFKDATGISLFSIKGQIKCADEIDFGPGVFAGVQGYFETMDDTDIQSGAKVWGVDSSIESPSGGTVTVDSGGILGGLHAELTGAGEFVQSSTGILAGLYIDEQVTTGCWGYGIYIADSATTTGIDIGTSTTGIEFGGTYASYGINMQAATPNTADDDKSLFRIGGYDTALALTSKITANTMIASIHIDSQANPDSSMWLVGSYNKIKISTADQANTNAVPVMVRADIGKPMAAFYGVQSHVSFSGTGDCSSEVIAGSFQTYGTAATGTGYHWGVKSDLRAVNTPSGAGHLSACFFGVGTVSCSTGLYIESLAATTMYSGVYLHAAGNITNAIEIGGAANVTSLFKFNAAAGPLSTLAADVAGDNTSHKLAIDIGGATYYLAVWSSVWS